MKVESTKRTSNNNNRIKAFDLARGLPILFMVIIHVLSFYGSPQVQESRFAQAIHYFIGWPSASIFVFMMGVFVAYNKTPRLTLGLKRAMVLFLLGYLLNLFRETIPTLLSLEMGLVTYEQLGIYTPIHSLLVVDILQNAALAYAICLLVKSYVAVVKYWVFLALVVIFGSPFLWDIQVNNIVVDNLLKILWGNIQQGALFPLFPWVAYPLLGMVFGQWFKNSSNKDQSFNLTLVFGLILIVVGRLIILSNPDYHIAHKMRHGPGLIISMTGIVFIWLWVFNFLTNKIKPNRVYELLYFWSRNVTTLYCIHWLFVGWGLMIFGAEQLDFSYLLLWMLAVVLLSDVTLRVWLYIIKRYIKNEKNSPMKAALNVKSCQ